MTGQPQGDSTFGGIFSEPPRTQAPPATNSVEIPDLASLSAMSVDDLEQLLLELVAEHQQVAPARLLEQSMSEGSLRTASVLMVSLINKISKRIGQPILRPADLDDSRRLRTLRGTATVFKFALERIIKDAK